MVYARIKIAGDPSEHANAPPHATFEMQSTVAKWIWPLETLPNHFNGSFRAINHDCFFIEIFIRFNCTGCCKQSDRELVENTNILLAVTNRANNVDDLKDKIRQESNQITWRNDTKCFLKNFSNASIIIMKQRAPWFKMFYVLLFQFNLKTLYSWKKLKTLSNEL